MILIEVYSYENKPFARNVLCRKFVKGIQKEKMEAPRHENVDLEKFQRYLFDASLQDELNWSYLGVGSCSAGSILAGKGQST